MNINYVNKGGRDENENERKLGNCKVIKRGFHI